MTSIKDFELTCPICENEFCSPIYLSINITLNPELLEKIYDRTINVVNCPKCKSEIHVNVLILFHDMKKKLLIWVKPEYFESFRGYLEHHGYFKNINSHKKQTQQVVNKKITEIGNEKTSIQIVNQLGMKLLNVIVSVRQIDDYFYYRNTEEIERTNNEGICKFHLNKGEYYIIYIKYKNYEYGCIKRIHSNNITFKIKSIFGWLNKRIIVPDEEISEKYEEARTDKSRCFLCQEKYAGFTDKYNCKYCKKNFCSKHRLPEEHDCWGEPTSPYGGFREIHSGGHITVYSK